jgi:hypothetical protein
VTEIMGNIQDLSNDVRKGRKHWDYFDPAIFALLTEVGLNFFRFLKSLGMSGERNLVVLSSKCSYSCDEHELKNVRIIINLKKLNLIKHLDLFLNTLVRILPPNTNFIGYFADEGNVNGCGINRGTVLRLMNRVFDLFGSRTNHMMNRNEVTELLGKNGFKTLAMKDMNGFTYFISQNVSMPL